MKLRAEQSELRDLSYPLYLCTSFVPANNQPPLQDLLSLSCHLTEAVLQPSEKMLKAIRVQWWLDCIKESQRQNSPLTDRLISRIENGNFNKDKLLFILEAFQQCIFEENPKQYVKRCWGFVFEYYSFMIDGKVDESISILGSQVGEIIYKLKTKENRELKDEFKQIDALFNEDGFVKSCKYLVYLYNKNKLRNFTLLPIRLFLNVLMSK